MEPIIPDNDSKFLEIIVRAARELDPNCIINIKSRLTSHTIDIQTVKEFKVRLMHRIMRLHQQFGLPFVASQFIKNRDTIISFELMTKN